MEANGLRTKLRCVVTSILLLKSFKAFSPASILVKVIKALLARLVSCSILTFYLSYPNFWRVFWINVKKYVKLFLKDGDFGLLDKRTDLQEEFLVSFIVLPNFVGSHNSDGVVILDGMSFLWEEAFFCITLILKSNITMVDVGFLFWIVPSSFSWEQFYIKDLPEIAEILSDFLFSAIIR